MSNASKWKITHFGEKSINITDTDYYMNGQSLLTVTEQNDLGVVISSDMKSYLNSVFKLIRNPVEY